MDRSRWNYTVDFLGLISFLVAGITGLVMFFFLPGGGGLGPFREFLGIERHIWREIHNWSGIVLVIVVLVHLILHWNWIVCMTKSVFSRKKGKGKGKKNVC